MEKQFQTLPEVISFVGASFESAIADRKEYGGIIEALDSHRENIRDTLREYGAEKFKTYAYRELDRLMETRKMEIEFYRAEEWMQPLIDAAQSVIDYSDSTGCDEGLTVTDSRAVEKLRAALANLR